jgi:vacuolar-type H+-ATPase subunit H
MSDEWIKEIKEIKEDTDKKIEDAQTKEIELIDKHEGEAKRILNMINDLCKSVVKTFI